jgi:adenylylsulfate kinase-like enzyme
VKINGFKPPLQAANYIYQRCSSLDSKGLNQKVRGVTNDFTGVDSSYAPFLCAELVLILIEDNKKNVSF